METTKTKRQLNRQKYIEAAEAIHRVKASELLGISGSHHLFGDERFIKLTIRHLSNGTINVSNPLHKYLVLNHDDSFRINRYSGKMVIIPGPSTFAGNPFKSVIAESILTPNLLVFNHHENFEMSEDQYVIGFDGEIEPIRLAERIWIGGNDKYYSGYKIYLICNKKNQLIEKNDISWTQISDGKLLSVVAHHSAGQAEADWLRKQLIRKDLLIRPSGAFAHL